MPATTGHANNVRSFHEQGYVPPFRAFGEDEMDELREQVIDVLATPPADHTDAVHNRHLDSAVVHRLATAAPVLDAMRALLGPDLLLWRTNFFAKEPGAKEIPWHQDVNYWPIEPAVVVSAWLAIDPATRRTSCVQLIPGTHRKVLPHVKAGPEMWFQEMADPAQVNPSAAVDMEVGPGEVFLFNERMLHHSDPNRSGRRRIGLAIRVVPPITRVLRYDSPAHGVVLVSGEDRMGFNRHVQPPG